MRIIYRLRVHGKPMEGIAGSTDADDNSLQRPACLHSNSEGIIVRAKLASIFFNTPPLVNAELESNEVVTQYRRGAIVTCYQAALVILEYNAFIEGVDNGSI